MNLKVVYRSLGGRHCNLPIFFSHEFNIRMSFFLWLDGSLKRNILGISPKKVVTILVRKLRILEKNMAFPVALVLSKGIINSQLILLPTNLLSSLLMK